MTGIDMKQANFEQHFQKHATVPNGVLVPLSLRIPRTQLQHTNLNVFFCMKLEAPLFSSRRQLQQYRSSCTNMDT